MNSLSSLLIVSITWIVGGAWESSGEEFWNLNATDVGDLSIEGDFENDHIIWQGEGVFPGKNIAVLSGENLEGKKITKRLIIVVAE